MNSIATTLTTRILKKQNEELILSICKEYGLSPEDMLRKYHTPSFYLPNVTANDVNIHIKDIKKSTKKDKAECVKKENEVT